MNNPYEKVSQDTEFNHWQAGFEAPKETDCPYESDDSDYKRLYKIWMKGFKSKNKHGKKSTEDDIQVENLDAVPTNVLESILMQRKGKELEQLQTRRVKLQETVEELDVKITKLMILCGK